jgi:hypothetical protein
MIEVTIKADTLSELHEKLRSFIAELVPPATSVAKIARENSPPVENIPETKDEAPAPSKDPEAHREELRALCVQIAAKHERRSSVVVETLQKVAGVGKVAEVPVQDLDAVEAALRELL